MAVANDGGRKARSNSNWRGAAFDQIRALYDAGGAIRKIARELGLGRRRVERWVRLIVRPDRNVMDPKACTAGFHGAFLTRRWAEGVTAGKSLFADIRQRGYTGADSHLARLRAPWRNAAQPIDAASAHPPADHEIAIPALDSITGRKISPLTAAALRVKPRGPMTPRQIANVDALKAASAECTTMRQLAMRFRGLSRGGSAMTLDTWLTDARRCGVHAMQRFAMTIRHEIDAVRNAVLEPWSSGQTEGQINRLKTLKRSMYGRAGVEWLRARMMPLYESTLHRE